MTKTRQQELKKAINQTEKLIKLANEGKIELRGYRPLTALQMQLGVYKSELVRAERGEEPMYKVQWYSDLPLDKAVTKQRKKYI